MMLSEASWFWSQLPLILSIIGGFASLIGIIAERWGKSSQRKTFAYILILAGGLLTISAATFTTIRQSEFNRDLLYSVTGGDSFCYVIPLLKQGIPSFTVAHHGKYPLYDVTFRIHDLDKSEALGEKSYHFENLFDDVIFSAKIGTLAPDSGRLFNEFKFPMKENLRFNIFFEARNGAFTQLLRMHKVGNEWKIASKITGQRGKTEHTFFEKIDKGFPLNDKGEVQW
jgi:hypothetical protein